MSSVAARGFTEISLLCGPGFIGSFFFCFNILSFLQRDSVDIFFQLVLKVLLLLKASSDVSSSFVPKAVLEVCI